MNIITIVLYELRIMLRNRVNLILLLVMPVAMIALMGYAMKPFLDAEAKGPDIFPVSYADISKDAIARSFDASIASVAGEYGISEKGLEIAGIGLEKTASYKFINVKEVKNPEARTLDSFQFFGAGMLIFFLLTCSMGLGINIINERADRVFFRIVSFPVTHNQYLAGKAIGNALIGFFQAASVILFTSLVFKVDWGNNYPGLFLVVAELMLVASGIAVIFSNLLNSSKTLSTLLTVLFWMMAFISGSFFPLPVFEPIAGFMINKWAFEVLTGFMTGQGIMNVLNYLILLLLIGLVFWTAGVMLYKRRVSNE